jgi:gamma-glutamylcyclotransferase (GGCT)/AIG2-like uncharacterized protein YtfP
VADAVFFYGTLMGGFDRRRRAGLDTRLRYKGRGSVTGSLFDLGIYPAAIPSSDGRIWGEIYEFDEEAVLAALDDIEGYTHSDPDRSLYTRIRTPVTLERTMTAAENGGGAHGIGHASGSDAPAPTQDAWVYFYNAPLGAAPRIPSGDYLAHIRAR